MERALFMPPLNMLARRWASTAPNKFQLSQLVPIRGWTRAAMDRRLRVWAELVGPSCPSQTQHFDKTPEAESDHDDHEEVRRVGIAKPVTHFAKQNRGNEERDDPPAALVAIVQPLDRGGRQKPHADDEDRSSHRIEQNHGRRGSGIAEADRERERREIAEPVEKIDMDRLDAGTEDAADGACHDRQEHHAGDRTGNDSIPVFGAVDAALETEQKRVAGVTIVHRASLRTAENGRRPVIWSQSIDLGSISPAAVR
jgi:hypothetical protein